MSRYRSRERSSEREGSEASGGPGTPRGKRSRSCGLPLQEGPLSLQPYVIRGGQRVRCRFGKRDGLQDDIPPPRKKEEGLKAPSEDIKKTSPILGDPVHPPVDTPPLLPIESPLPPPAVGQPVLPDVCPLCRSQTYNLPNLLCLHGAPQPPPPLGQLPGFYPCPHTRPWAHTLHQAAAGRLCQCCQPLDDADGQEVPGHAKRLQCCGEAAAKMAEQIEKSLQHASAVEAKSNAKRCLRRSLSRGESVSLKKQHLDRPADVCLKMVQEAKAQPATYNTPVNAATVPNIQTPWSINKQQSTNFSKEIHCYKNVVQTQSSLEPSQERHCHASAMCAGAGDRSSSPGPQCKCCWCVTQPGAQFGSQSNVTGDPIGTVPGALMSPYSVVCPHHPQWHSVCKCVHRIPFVLQTQVTPDESKQIETEVENSVSQCSSQNIQKDGDKSLKGTNKCTSRNIQQASRNLKDCPNVFKSRRKLETTKTAACCQAREMATQTFISCVKNTSPNECNESSVFASRGILYGKVYDSLQTIDRAQRDSGTQTILTVARITPSASLGISGTASKETVCGSPMRTIGRSNSMQSLPGLQSICPIVRKLIPSRTESVKSVASKGTICNRSERVVQPTRPEGREIAIQAGGSILEQLRASKSVEQTPSVQRPISRPRSLSSTSSPFSSAADAPTTHQSETTFPLVSRPEDALELPYLSWPSTAASASGETLHDKEYDLHRVTDVLSIVDSKRIGDVTILTPLSTFARADGKMKLQVPSTNTHSKNHQPAGREEASRRYVNASKGSAVIAKNRRENGCAALVGKALQPKGLRSENQGQAQGAKAVVSAGPPHRPPAKRPLERAATLERPLDHVPMLQGQRVQRETKQKLLTNTSKSDGCEQQLTSKDVTRIADVELQNGQRARAITSVRS